MSKAPPAAGASPPRSEVLMVYLNIVIYAFCYMMQAPVLPKLVSELAGGDDGKVAWAKLQTAFAMSQVVGGFVAGYLSDALGPKAVLLISHAASALVYAGQASATGMTHLYLSRVPALLQHAFMGSAAYVAKSTASEDRGQGFAYLQMSYGVGMAIGPLLGGYIGETDVHLPSYIAVCGSLLACVLVALVLPSDAKFAAKDSEAKPSLGRALGVLARPAVLRVCCIKLFASLAMGTWQTMSAVVGRDNLNFGPKYQGYLLSYASVVSMVFIALGVVKVLETRMSDAALNAATAAVIGAAFLALPQAQTYKDTPYVLPIGEGVGINGSFIYLCACLIPVVACTTILRSTISSQFTRTVDSSQSGTILGIDMGVSSAVSLATPSIGVYLHTQYGFEGVSGFCCAAIATMAVVSMLVPAAKQPLKAE